MRSNLLADTVNPQPRGRVTEGRDELGRSFLGFKPKLKVHTNYRLQLLFRMVGWHAVKIEKLIGAFQGGTPGCPPERAIGPFFQAFSPRPDSTTEADRNHPELIENNQSRYTPLDNGIGLPMARKRPPMSHSNILAKATKINLQSPSTHGLGFTHSAASGKIFRLSPIPEA